MNLLVTGGAGYVGSHTAKLLVSEGHDVWVYDNLCNGHRGAVPEGKLIVGDLHQRELLEGAMCDHKIDAVLHFAAFAEVGESVEFPHRYWKNNVIGTLSLLEAMRATDVKRIVFSSTTATYGEPKTIPITEQEMQLPINPYGFSKLAIERALQDYAKAYGFGYAALRYFNAAGAAKDGTIGEDHTPESHLIPIVLQVALGQREKISIFGDTFSTPDGTCIRDYIHVEDLATAHLSALGRLESGKGLEMNLGTGRGTSVREIIDAARRVTGHPIPAEVGPVREGDPPELVADSSLAQKTLDWKPKYTNIESIIETAWRWHQAHPKGYED